MDEGGVARSAAWARVAAGLVLALGVLAFGVNGVRRAADPQASGNADWRLVYSAARTWLEGGQPYDASAVREVFSRSPGAAGHDAMSTRDSTVLVYPPPALAAYAPFAALPWRVASPVWTALTIGCVAAAALACGSMAGLGVAGRMGLLGVTLLLAPSHTLVWQGQTAGPVVALAAVASWLVWAARGRGLAGGAPDAPRRRADAIAGVLLGVASVLKPQLGLVFLVYHAGRWRWWVAGAGAATIALLLAVGVGRLGAAGVAWTSAWAENVRLFTSVGDAAPTSNNPIRYHLINLHYPLHAMLGDAAPVGGLVLALAGAVALAYLRFDWTDRADRGERARVGSELVSLSLASAVTLFAAYHRIYDAVLLVFPTALALRLGALGAWRWGPGWRVGLALLWAIILSFLGPWSVAVTHLAERGRVPAGLAASPAWGVLVVPAQAWAVLVLAGLCVAFRAGLRRRPGS